MSESELLLQTQWVLLLAAAVGGVFGAIMQRTGFCTMGAVTDILSVHDWTRLRQWSLAIATSVLGAGVLGWMGQVDLSKTLYVMPRLNVASVAVGSFLFGVGMVLAAGCSSKTLVRIGEGNLKALIVFLVLGLSAWMTLKGFFGVVRVNTLDTVSLSFPAGQDLPRVLSGALGGDAATLRLLLSVALAVLFAGFAVAKRDFWQASNWVAGLGIGACSVALFYVSGHVGYLAEDPNTLQEAFLGSQSGRLEGLSFVAPYAQLMEWLVFYSDASRKLTLGIVLVPAVVLGSCLSAVLTRSFHWQGFSSNEELANHLVGGVLMGFGGVTALGCTVGQGLTGVSTLAVGSLLSLPGFVLGGLLAMKYLEWRSLPPPCVPLKYIKKDDEPLNLQRHNDNFSTAGQISLGDLSDIARMGFKSVINNRPDGEGGSEQPTSAAVEQACQSLGLRYAYLPVISGQMRAEEAQAMARLLEELPHPVLAFCRSGTRSTHLYLAARHIE